MKSARHARILEIIENRVVETQDELAEQLRASGFNVTQATVSRDIKELIPAPEVRRRIIAGEDVHELLHPDVWSYIVERGLYNS